MPAQTVDFGEAAPTHAIRNALGSWNVPVEVNSLAGEWIFDTGANLSTLTESEAKRMGLVVRESKAYVNGSTGKRNALRVAVAPAVRFGPARLHNVVFLVLADESLYIPPIHQQIHGILGLPVLRALGRVGIAHDGAVHFDPSMRQPEGTPNLCFDSGSLLVEITHEKHELQMMLDTGANVTDLYRSFRLALTSQETAKLKSKKDKVGGAGGSIQRKTFAVPQLRILFEQRPVDLQNLSLLSDGPKGEGHYRDGVIGMDALWGGFMLDFQSMRLTVD